MRPLLLVVLALFSGTAMAQQLTIDALTSGKSLSGNALTQAKFSPDGKRISFLKGKPDKAGQLDLWTFDVATGEARMLVDSATLAGSNKELSDEEKARRERQRIAALTGIVEYQWSPDGYRLLFPMGGELFWFDLAAATPERALRQLTNGTGDVTDDDQLNDMGDGALGVVTSHHYSAAHPSAANKKFVEAFQKANKNMRPNFMAVGGYDGMRVIYEALRAAKTTGKAMPTACNTDSKSLALKLPACRCKRSNSLAICSEASTTGTLGKVCVKIFFCSSF